MVLTMNVRVSRGEEGARREGRMGQGQEEDRKLKVAPVDGDAIRMGKRD